MSTNEEKDCAMEKGSGGKDDMANSSQHDEQSKEVPPADLSNIRAKKASRRGKMSHVTKLLNNIYKLIETSGSTRELDRAINSLSEALVAL